jgi:hypothetical protein
VISVTEIKVERIENDEDSTVFSVEVSEKGSSSNHRVTLADTDYEKLAPKGVEREGLVEESFRFLLEREPKESILSSFELTVIENYFPEYEEKIKGRLEN